MDKIDEDLLEKFKRAFEDIKHGRLTEWKPCGSGASSTHRSLPDETTD